MTRRRAAALGAIALLAAAGAAFALTRPEHETVPSVIERPTSEARSLLERRGFEVAVTTVPACATPSTVIEQDPLAGTEAEQGSAVTLTVSLGLSVEVPQVRDLTEAEATRRLQREDLLVETRRRSSRGVDAGRVIGTEPPAGEEVDCESTVTLLVSEGPDLVALGDFIGESREVAEAELRRQGLIPNIETRDADEPEGTVIGQDPGSGSRLEKGTEVTLIVSTGAGSVLVPDVEGLSEDSARETLQARGLSVEIVELQTDEASEDGRVLDQAPSAGTRLRAGDFVSIFVGVLVEPEPEPTPEAGGPQSVNPRAGR